MKKKYPKLNPNLLIFASGDEEGGGSGFEKLIEAINDGTLKANPVAVVSNHEFGGVRRRADRLGIRFIYSPKGRTAEDYKRIIKETEADFVALSGWLGKIEGHDPSKTINIHPAYMPSNYHGKGFFGHHVHEAVLADYKDGLVKHHGVTIHWATEIYDDPSTIIFRTKVEIKPDDTVGSLAARVNAVEHLWQAKITNLVVTGAITWNGIKGSPVVGAIIEG